MAVTATLQAGATPIPGLDMVAIFKITPDSAFAAAGEAFTGITNYFSKIDAIMLCGVSDVALGLYKFDFKFPPNTLLTADSDVLIYGSQAPAASGDAAAAQPFDALAGTEDLDAYTFNVMVFGKAAV